MYKLAFALLTAILLVNCTPKTGDTMSNEKKNQTMETVKDKDFRATAPAAAPARKVKAGEFSDFTLDNGLKVIVVENHKLPRVSYNLRVDRDPIMEKDKVGFSNLAGTLLKSGTNNRTKEVIDEEIDFMGARLSTGSGHIYASSLTKHSESLLDVMTDILYNANFPEEGFEKERKKTLSNIASNKSDASAIMRNIRRRVVYGIDHPYGEIITEESVNNIAVEDLREYYKTYFKPNISYLIIVGDITVAKAKKNAKKYFGSWEKGEVVEDPMPEVSTPESREVYFVDKPGAVQSVISLAHPVQLQPGEEMEIAASVANSILGGGVFSGYLMQNLREDKGYTYGARSSLSSDEHVGNFRAGASVRNEVTDSSIIEFLREMNRLRNEPVDPEHLALTKSSMAGSYARSLESPQAIANQAYRIAKYNLPEDYYDTYLQKLESVTAEDVMKAAVKYVLPNAAQIIVVGNKEEVASKLDRFDFGKEISFLNPEGMEIEDSDMPIPEGVTAETVIDKFISAIGGREAFENIKTISWVMNTEVQGNTIQSTRHYLFPDKFVESQKMQGMEISSTVFDGSKAMVNSPQGSQEITDPAEIASMQRKAQIYPELFFDKSSNSASLAAAQNIDGKETYKVKYTDETGKSFTHFYDAETGLKVREVFTQKVMERTVTITTEYGPYKEINGVKLPLELTITGAAPFPLVLNAVDIKVNEELDPSLFEIE